MSDEKRTWIAEGATFGLACCILVRSNERHLRVSNRAPMIVMTYAAIDALGALPPAADTRPAAIAHEPVETFLADILSRAKPVAALD
jgi:tRNA U34 5-methylaminomethyl-2-thiouridine-forming methyltransferase MnmC